MNDSFHIKIPFKEKIKNSAVWLDFNKSVIIKGFFGSLALFLPVVFAGVGVESKALFTILAVISLLPLFILDKKELFWLGAFSGILWFYWIGFSLYYYDMLWMLPIVWGFAFFYYGGLFWLIGFLSKPLFWLKIPIVAFIFDYLSPLGFDWLRPETLCAYSYFGAHKIHILAILTGVALLAKFKKFTKSASILPLAAALSFAQNEPKELPPLKIELIATNIEQGQKWDERFKLQITKQNLEYIDRAAKDGANLVVLPETAFPYFLNKAPTVIEALKERSYTSAILTGSLKLDRERVYNSSYLFKDGKMYIFDKVVAVPFGEVNPLPKFMSDIVNHLFFGGAEDYKTADHPSDFEIGGVCFRNAICYEATSEELYKDAPRFVIAISNNAWFVPSFEPTIQKMLMRHISKKFGSVILHTSNKSGFFIIN